MSRNSCSNKQNLFDKKLKIKKFILFLALTHRQVALEIIKMSTRAASHAGSWYTADGEYIINRIPSSKSNVGKLQKI